MSETPERYQLTRDRRKAAGQKPFFKRDVYIAELKAGRTSAEAFAESGAVATTLGEWRMDKSFAAQEMSIITGTKVTAEQIPALLDDLSKQWYLQALKDADGHHSEARAAANLSRMRFEKLCEDPKFRDDVLDVAEWIVDDIEQQAVRAASGKATKIRDPAHALKMLAFLRKERYGAQPTIHEIKYSGSITVQAANAHIHELLGTDEIEDGEIVETPG